MLWPIVRRKSSEVLLSSYMQINRFAQLAITYVQFWIIEQIIDFLFPGLQDLPGALDDAAITEALELHKIKNRQWAIFKTSAIKGEGLFEGLDW